MKPIPFYKMSGSGNDFMIIDNREKVVDINHLNEFIAKICRRKMSVGADGFILIDTSDRADFGWHFYNSDGGRAEMCGNGARCAARFAFLNGIAAKKMSFETDAGILIAQIIDDRVKIKMPDPAELRLDYPLEVEAGPLAISSINTGVPHVVILTEDVEGIDVVERGREIRFHPAFAPAGTNVNFISLKQDNTIIMRTYERGVEDETLACGTGAIAGALVTASKFKTESPIRVCTRSGEFLTIYFKMIAGSYGDIYLEGDARVIYKAELGEDAWS
ncbi:MAG: diaminopimelate epimerase [Desulfobacterales bacterium]